MIATLTPDKNNAFGGIKKMLFELTDGGMTSFCEVDPQQEDLEVKKLRAGMIRVSWMHWKTKWVSGNGMCSSSDYRGREYHEYSFEADNNLSTNIRVTFENEREWKKFRNAEVFFNHDKYSTLMLIVPYKVILPETRFDWLKRLINKPYYLLLSLLIGKKKFDEKMDRRMEELMEGLMEDEE